MQRQQPVVARPGASEISRQRSRAHLCHQLGRDIGGDRDYAVATDQHERQSGAVVAAVDREILPVGRAQRRDELAATAKIGRRILDAHNARHLRQPQRRLVRKIGDRAPGDVVENQRQVHGFGDCAEMAVQALLRGLVVVRHDRKTARCAGLLRVRGQGDRLLGRIGAGAGDDRADVRARRRPPS